MTRTDLLAQIGTTEQALRDEFTSGLTGVGQQVTDAETRLKDAIAAAEAAGLDRDSATRAAIDSVAADLGLTRTDLLAQIGATEQSLRDEFTTQIGGVQANILEELAAQEQARQAEAARQEQARQAEAARQAQAAKVQQARQGVMSVAQQLPQLIQQSMTTTTPIYAQMGPRFEFGQPLDTRFFNQRRQKPVQTAGTQATPPTKMATGGYLGDSDGPQSLDDLLRILN